MILTFPINPWTKYISICLSLINSLRNLFNFQSKISANFFVKTCSKLFWILVPLETVLLFKLQLYFISSSQLFVVNVYKYNLFLHTNSCFVILLKLLINSSRIFFKDSLGFSLKIIISFMNRESLISSFQAFYCFYVFIG